MTKNQKEKIAFLDKENFRFADELHSIIEDYKNGIEDPLDGDEVDDLTEILRAKLNLIEGNITEKEYHKLLK